MKTLIKAGLVYPVIGEPVRNGNVAVADGMIERVGKTDDFNETSFDSVIDLSGHLLLPGLVNAHSHLQFAAASGKTERGAEFTDWIRQAVRANEEITQAERASAMRRGIDEMMRSGITAVGDITVSADFAGPLLDSPIKSVIFIEPLAPHEKDAKKTALYVREEIEKLQKKGANAGVAPHSPYTVSPELLKQLKALSENMKLPFSMHLAETAEEDLFVRKGAGELAELLKSRNFLPEDYTGSGKSPVALLRALGVLDGCLAAHLNAIDNDDAVLLAKHNVVPVFCPQSSKWFGRKKLLPLEYLLSAGTRPAIGTDSLASNDSLSMLDELRCAVDYFPEIGKKTFLEMATINGANSLGLNCGAISRGKWADLIGFKWDGASDPLDCLFKAEKADFVMIGGVTLSGPDGIK